MYSFASTSLLPSVESYRIPGTLARSIAMGIISTGNLSSQHDAAHSISSAHLLSPHNAAHACLPDTPHHLLATQPSLSASNWPSSSHMQNRKNSTSCQKLLTAKKQNLFFLMCASKISRTRATATISRRRIHARCDAMRCGRQGPRAKSEGDGKDGPDLDPPQDWEMSVYTPLVQKGG